MLLFSMNERSQEAHVYFQKTSKVKPFNDLTKFFLGTQEISKGREQRMKKNKNAKTCKETKTETSTSKKRKKIT